jgi:hypothetical protein
LLSLRRFSISEVILTTNDREGLSPGYIRWVSAVDQHTWVLYSSGGVVTAAIA